MPAKKKIQSVAARVLMSPASTTSPLSLDAFLTYVQNNFVILFVLILIFLGGFFYGSLWTENKAAKSGRVGTVVAPNGPSTVAIASNGEAELIHGTQLQAQVEATIEKYL